MTNGVQEDTWGVPRCFRHQTALRLAALFWGRNVARYTLANYCSEERQKDHSLHSIAFNERCVHSWDIVSNTETQIHVAIGIYHDDTKPFSRHSMSNATSQSLLTQSLAVLLSHRPNETERLQREVTLSLASSLHRKTRPTIQVSTRGRLEACSENETACGEPCATSTNRNRLRLASKFGIELRPNLSSQPLSSRPYIWLMRESAANCARVTRYAMCDCSGQCHLADVLRDLFPDLEYCACLAGSHFVLASLPASPTQPLSSVANLAWVPRPHIQLLLCFFYVRDQSHATSPDNRQSCIKPRGFAQCRYGNEY